MTIDDVKKLIAPIHRRVMHMFGKGVIEKVDDAAEDQQECQVSILEDEVTDETERMQNYGFTSNPKPGADALIAFIGGTRDHGVIIAVDDARYRLKSLAPGEVAIYTDEGDKIVLKRGRKIQVTTMTLEVVAPSVTMSGNLAVAGNVTAGGTVTGAALASGGAASVAGALAVTGEVTANGVPLSTHKHLSSAPGVDTGPPHA